MQREEPDGIVISCDFCGVDWDGQAAMVEGHHGSVLCLDCMKLALDYSFTGDGPYRCVLCLREALPASLPRWRHEGRPDTLVCQDCVHQAAKAFSRAAHVDFTWQAAKKV